MRLAWLDRIPLKRKLAMSMILVMAASFALSGIITGTYALHSERRAMKDHLNTLAAAIGDNCSAALVFDDGAAAAEILSALEFDHSITRAVLTDERSVVVATSGGAAAGHDASPHGGSGRPFARELRVDRRIEVDGQLVGYLTIWAETTSIVTRLATEAVVNVTAFLLGVLVALFVFERMQRLVVGPLVDLHETVRRVVRSRDYSIRAQRSAGDELNDLVMAVNDLLAQVEQRTASPAAPSGAPQPAPAAEAAPPAEKTPAGSR